jgi:hypothetical protein
MKIKTVAVFLIVIFSSISALAEDRCIECRQAALREWQKCMASAKTTADMAACKEQGQKLQESCDNGEGICKVTISDQEKKEWALVIDFVKNNMDVIREVGNFKNAVSKASYKAPGEPMPSRYMVYVLGGNKPTYAVVDVSRLSGETKPTLACITHIAPPEFRGPLKDICKQ